MTAGVLAEAAFYGVALDKTDVSRMFTDLLAEALAVQKQGIDEKVVRDLIPKLKDAGATGLVEYPLNKVIP